MTFIFLSNSGTDATATPGTDVTATPGTDVTATPGADVTATPGTDVTQNPDATVAPTFDPVTAKEGTLTVTTNVSGASIKVISGGATEVALTMNPLENSITTTTLKPGTYTVEITKKGYDKKTETVVIDGNKTLSVALEETLVIGASAKVENSLVGYDNVVLVNDNAIVTVVMRDADGNPVANKSVVLSLSNPVWYVATPDSAHANRGFEVKGNTVVTTDANGKASFVVGQKDSISDSTDKQYVGSTEFRASVIGTNESASGCVGFASIDVGAVSSVDDDLVNDGNLTAGENFRKNEAGITINASTSTVGQTTSLNNDPVEYVLSQQVSSEGDDEHALTFKVNPQIYLPAMSKTGTVADDFQQPVNETSGKYGTYDSVTKDIPLKVDTSELQYATLNFSSISLSPYSVMSITSYSDLDKTDKVGDTEYVKGGKSGLVQKDFAYQIPINTDSVKVITVTIESAGQVETDMNDGYVITDITGVYKKAADSSQGGPVTLNTAKVTWEAVKPTMSEIKRLEWDKAEDLAKLTALGLDITQVRSKVARFEYQVPVFPNTGDAVIRAYDSNDKVVAYYLAATVKAADNTNVLDTTVKAYKATAEEAENVVMDGVTTNGNSVTVNSEKVGSTTLKGSISIAGLGSDLLDASNNKVYTSVQWNPIPKTADVSDSNAFAAIAGQKVTVYAQLTDKNGNPVSLANQDVTFTTTSGTTTSIKTDVGGTEFGDAGVVKIAKTDVNGRAALVLSSADARSVLDIEATGGTQYDAKLVIGDKTVDQADLYWVNANLQFLKNVGDDKNDTVGDEDRNTTKNDSFGIEVSQPYVGTPWEYGVKAVGDTIGANDGVLSGYDIDIDGLKIIMSANDDNKGTYEEVGNGKMSATSEYSNVDKIQAKLNEDSVSGDITFTATQTGYPTLTLTCVGEGRPNMNSRINLSVDWKIKGAASSLIAPNGTNISKISADASHAETKLYLKLTDETGKNPVADKTVTFTSNNDVDKLGTDVNGVKTYAGDASNSIDVTTDDKGVAVVYVKALTDGTGAVTSSIISAKVADIDQVASTTINYVDGTDYSALGVVRAKMVEDTKNQIELTFNNEICADSINTNEFTLTSKDGSNKKTTYDIASVKASANKVILTTTEDLTANEYKVAIDKYTKDGITYNLADEIGQALVSDNTPDTGKDEVYFYSTKNASFEMNVVGEKVTISGIKTPVGDDDDDFVATASAADFIKKFVVVVDGKVMELATDGSKDLQVSADSAGTYSFTITSDADDKQNVYVYYMGGSNSDTIGTDEEVANKYIALDAAAVVTAGTKATADGSALAFTTSGTYGSTITVTELKTVDTTYHCDSSNNVSIDTAAGTSIVDVAISLTGGTTVYRTFKLESTDSGSTFTSTNISGTKEANDAAIAAAKADTTLFPANFGAANATANVPLTEAVANKFGVTLKWQSNDVTAVTVDDAGLVTPLVTTGSGKKVTCTISRGNGDDETVEYSCTFSDAGSGVPNIVLSK